VKISTKGTCFPGDADAIEMDLKSSPSHKLLATLESLSDGGQSLSWNLPEDFLARGLANNTFNLPVRAEPSEYGFYICTANSSDKSCKDKVAKDVNYIFAEHIRKTPNAGKESRIIFFQYFLLDSRGLAAFASAKNNYKKFEELKFYGKERGIQSRKHDQEIEKVRNMMNTLYSYPFVFDGSTLRIELPKYNIEACQKKGV
jgi:hypothetical protein